MKETLPAVYHFAFALPPNKVKLSILRFKFYMIVTVLSNLTVKAKFQGLPERSRWEKRSERPHLPSGYPTAHTILRIKFPGPSSAYQPP